MHVVVTGYSDPKKQKFADFRFAVSVLLIKGASFSVCSSGKYSTPKPASSSLQNAPIVILGSLRQDSIISRVFLLSRLLSGSPLNVSSCTFIISPVYDISSLRKSNFQALCVINLLRLYFHAILCSAKEFSIEYLLKYRKLLCQSALMMAILFVMKNLANLNFIIINALIYEPLSCGQ